LYFIATLKARKSPESCIFTRQTGWNTNLMLQIGKPELQSCKTGQVSYHDV